MPTDTAAVAKHSPLARSKIANGTRPFLADGRSAEARLLRDRMVALAEPFETGNLNRKVTIFHRDKSWNVILPSLAAFDIAEHDFAVCPAKSIKFGEV